MKALITGASSGIGKSFAYELAKKNIDLILVARREENLQQITQEIQDKFHVKVNYVSLDITNLENVEKLIQENQDIDILINNAGFGDSGNFLDTDLDKELKMIDLNIKSLHFLTKKYLQIFSQKNYGYILNVSSLAAFQSGPKMATYYATKAYVLHLSEAINYELKKAKKQISITTLCPGPVNTEFNKVANVKFHLKELDPNKVAKKAIIAMFKRKNIIIPSFIEKIGIFFQRFIPRRISLSVVNKIQEKKQNGK